MISGNSNYSNASSVEPNKHYVSVIQEKSLNQNSIQSHL